MKTFQEFHTDRILNEVAFALPAIPYLVGGAKILTDLAISVVVTKLGYDAITSDAVKSASEMITGGGIEVAPLTQASPEIVIDAIAPHVTSEGTVAVTTEAVTGISSLLDIPTQVVTSVLTYAAGLGLSTLDVCLIFGAGTALTAAGGYMYYKNNGPKKFKKLLKKALEKIVKLLKMAGRVALHAFMLTGRAAAAAISTVWGWVTGLISAGLMAIVKKVISKIRDKDESEDIDLDDDSKSSQDLPNTQTH